MAALKAAPSRGIGRTPVFPATRNPAEPTPSQTFVTWLQRAKRRWLASVADPVERAQLKERLWRLGYHGEKRAGVRDPEFRALPPAIQEELAGTNYNTLTRIYDKVTLEDMKQAIELRKKTI